MKRHNSSSSINISVLRNSSVREAIKLKCSPKKRRRTYKRGPISAKVREAFASKSVPLDYSNRKTLRKIQEKEQDER